MSPQALRSRLAGRPEPTPVQIGTTKSGSAPPSAGVVVPARPLPGAPKSVLSMAVQPTVPPPPPSPLPPPPLFVVLPEPPSPP